MLIHPERATIRGKMATGTEIKSHIEKLIELRLPTQDQAHDEFNKGVKFVTDYVLEFINIQHKQPKLTKWQYFRENWLW